MKTSRRRFLATAAIVASSFGLNRTAYAQSERGQSKKADFLFVQTASGMSFDPPKKTLTLNGISPVTVFFSDRPQRIAGNMHTAHFIPFWSEGKDSFKSDPPNADVSILEDGQLKQVVVVLQAPVLKGDELSYSIEVLKGEMPTKGSDVSVFIDIIGRPLTPFSYAGVARRRFRRAYYLR